MIHQFDPEMASDAEFEPGELGHLVVGNRGRMLDPRRTPILVTGIDSNTGHFMLRIEGFEDVGAEWDIPFESVDRYQFHLGSRRAGQSELSSFQATVSRLNRLLEIPCDPDSISATNAKLEVRIRESLTWLERESRFLQHGEPLDFGSRSGSEPLASDLATYMRQRDLGDMEAAFAARWVSNPRSGELVKGHRIVIAQLGLVPFIGKVVRTPNLFAGKWDAARREAHVLNRIAFIRAFFLKCGHQSVTLYRGLCCDEAPLPPVNETFVSASFSFDVAKSCTGDQAMDTKVGVLYRQRVPVERIFMTYFETAAFNRQFHEAEAVLLWEPANHIF